MPVIKPVKGINPKIGDNCYLAENATVVGEVTMGDNCSVWFNTVVRGDVNSITIGDNTNIPISAIRARMNSIRYPIFSFLNGLLINQIVCFPL